MLPAKAVSRLFEGRTSSLWQLFHDHQDLGESAPGPRAGLVIFHRQWLNSPPLGRNAAEVESRILIEREDAPLAFGHVPDESPAARRRSDHANVFEVVNIKVVPEVVQELTGLGIEFSLFLDKNAVHS